MPNTCRVVIATIWLAASLVAHVDAQSENSRSIRHDVWTFKDGAPEQIFAIAQTSDGYLWLGSACGLFRFDGARFEPFRSPFGDVLPATNITALRASASGGLWIGYQFGGFSLLKNGHVRSYPATPRTVLGIAEEASGIAWAATAGGLMRFDGSAWSAADDWGVRAPYAQSVALDRAGRVWVIAENTLFCLVPGEHHFRLVRKGLPTAAFTRDGAGHIWTGPGGGSDPIFTEGSAALVDGDGGLWEAPDSGGLKYRSPSQGVQLYDLGAVYVGAMLVDREGNIWIGADAGLHRFFYSPLVNQPLPITPQPVALVAEHDGAMWFGTRHEGLFRLRQGRTERWDVDDELSCGYRDVDGTIWFGGVGRLWRLSGTTLREVPLPVQGPRAVVQAITGERSGALWVSIRGAGTYRLDRGTWTARGARAEFPNLPALTSFSDPKGRIWFGFTSDQLAVVDGERVRVFDRRDGVRVGQITALYGRDSRLWIGGELGLQAFVDGRILMLGSPADEDLRGISGIVERSNGDLWLNGLAGIVHLSRGEIDRALADSGYRPRRERIGRHDGLPGFAPQVRPIPSAVEGSDGRLWFDVTSGVVWIDPTREPPPRVPAPVTIQTIAVDDRVFDAGEPLTVLPGASSLRIRYSAVSLTKPDEIRFRYRLLGDDDRWHDVGTASEVTYRNLTPGTYEFRVAAEDIGGERMDGQASHVAFRILPAFYQTGWFRALMLVGALVAIYFAYVMRIAHVSARVRDRFAAQMLERERIARDLHDTLLQGVTGLALQVHAATRTLPAHDSARRQLETALTNADQILVEGRDAVRGLRQGPEDADDLEAACAHILERLNPNASTPCHTRVVGARRSLHPLVQREVVWIAQEALTNAFAHANATRIEIEIVYGRAWFGLSIRDDGVGMPRTIVAAGGREGHWGLVGMRERAERAGGRLKMRSVESVGTDLELRIPWRAAYLRRRITARESHA